MVLADSVALATDTLNFVGTANEIETAVSDNQIQIGLPSAVTVGSLTTSGNVVVGGDLTVSGTTTTVNTETINLADNQILLNSNETGTPSQNGGIEIERGTETNKTLVWNETSDKWTVGSETFVAGTFEGNLTGNVTGNAATATTAGALTGDVTSSGDFTVDATGDIILDADGNDFKFKNGAGGDTATLSFADSAALKLSNTQTTTVETTDSGADIKLTTLDRSGGVTIHSNASSTYNMRLVYGNSSNKAALSSTGGLLLSSEDILLETSTGEVTVDADLLVNESLILTEGTEDWTVTASGTNLTFAYNGVNKMRLDSSGNLTVTGDVTAFGSL